MWLAWPKTQALSQREEALTLQGTPDIEAPHKKRGPSMEETPDSVDGRTAMKGIGLWPVSHGIQGNL